MDNSPINYDFANKLGNSMKTEIVNPVITILNTIFKDNTGIVMTTDPVLDKAGCDFTVNLQHGVKCMIDHKHRDPGCSRFWKVDAMGVPIPELAPEIWSVVPGNGLVGNVGWTLDDTKITHGVICTFHLSDTTAWYYLPFGPYKEVFKRRKDEWMTMYEAPHQSSNNGQWYSQCVFVPAHVIVEEVTKEYNLWIEQGKFLK